MKTKINRILVFPSSITLVEWDTVHNPLVVKLGHLPDFALFGKDMMAVYLPMIVKP
ncbi:MAG: hypothetical protein WAS33_11580 [Candidatus Promineifilaceae bacterium]|nr:hypothetical protein [Anaerolineaceae bacterium]